MVWLNFKNSTDLEKGETVLRKSKLNWKRNVFAVRIPQRKLNFLDCDNDKLCKECEIRPNLNFFEC